LVINEFLLWVWYGLYRHQIKFYFIFIFFYWTWIKFILILKIHILSHRT
jgi:hypothetical protein